MTWASLNHIITRNSKIFFFNATIYKVLGTIFVLLVVKSCVVRNSNGSIKLTIETYYMP